MTVLVDVELDIDDDDLDGGQELEGQKDRAGIEAEVGDDGQRMDGEQLTDFAAVGASAGDGIFRLGRTSAILLLLFDFKKIIFFVGLGGGIGVANSLNLLKRWLFPQYSVLF